MDATHTPEEWRPVVGHEGVYEISSLGRVRTVARVAIRRNGSPMPVRARILKTFRTPPMGYHAVKLQCGGRHTRVTARVHILVLEAFVGPRPEGLVGCHDDGDVDNNGVDNLRWDTQQSNVGDVVRHGHHREANKTHCKRNHAFTLENTYINPTSGARQCRQCVRELNRRIRMSKQPVAA